MDQPKASGLPSITSYDDFDVFSGKDGLSREESKRSTFHTSDMEDGDAAFRKKAELMEGSGGSILGDTESTETAADKAADEKTKKQVKEAAL